MKDNEPPLTGQDILDAGYPSGPIIGEMLKATREYAGRGITDRKYVLKLLKREFPPPAPKATMRSEPAPIVEAIEATSEEEEKNVAAVRRCMRELLKTPVVTRGAVMPDACPAGPAPATIPVGGVIAVENALIPSAHSADICCSMYTSVFESDQAVGEQLDALMASTRFGMGGRRPDDLVHHPVIEEPVWDNPFLNGLEHWAEIHMADQGDGNHFASVGELTVREPLKEALSAAGHSTLANALLPTGYSGAERTLRVLVTHHGSRGLGARVYKKGQQVAIKQTARAASGVPNSAAWIDFSSEEGEAYWEALQYVSRWTKANHQAVHRRFLGRIGVSPVAEFGNEHNFIWKRGDVFLHGKGATPAWRDENGNPLLGLIPLNMAAPILLVLGKDNPDCLSFAPHGAGRNRSRTATFKAFRNKDGSLDEARIARTIEQTTHGVDIRWFYGKPDLSETPLAYKSADQVRAQIEQFGLAEVIAEIRPLGCVMAGDPGPKPWMRKKELTPKQKRQIQHRAERRKRRQGMKSGGWDETS